MDWRIDLYFKILAVCPIRTIRFVETRIKFTWEIIFEDRATEEQRKLAENIINNFDMAIIDIPVKTEIELLEERIAALEAKSATPTPTRTVTK